MTVKRKKLVVPEHFPHFTVPEYQEEMNELRELYWTFYEQVREFPTLWDEWLTGATLWPGLPGVREQKQAMWREVLSNRFIDREGYVASHQHASIAHQDGWPFPFWGEELKGTWGWHFSLDKMLPGLYSTTEKTQVEWTLENGRDMGISDLAWNLQASACDTAIVSPEMEVNPEFSPFIQLRWKAVGLSTAQPYIQWAGKGEEFTQARRMFFDPVEDNAFTYTMIPLFRHPLWKGNIHKLRICFGNHTADSMVHVQAVFTQFDTRHSVNNSNFIRGCIAYFNWTGDLAFLRSNIQRMRYSMHYNMTVLGGSEHHCIVVPYVGHCGRTGFSTNEDGSKQLYLDRGIGHNYWDLLPCGKKDAYATIHYYDTLLRLAELEETIAEKAEWNIPAGPLWIAGESLRKHAAQVKEVSTKLFWNPANKRFHTGLDIDGNSYDYGYVFLNIEAVYYDFATAEQSKSIYEWINGERLIEGDTSQGKDIYHWRLGPRMTTRRNIEYYGFQWHAPETVDWGDQVQDGGAVLGFSYQDMMVRLRLFGPDDCWQRLKEIIAWYSEVQDAGGPREYYKDGSNGKLQGGNVPGGIGIDKEFLESILVPQIIIDGFLGFKPMGDRIHIQPQLPSDWSSLRIHDIVWNELKLDVTATGNSIEIQSNTLRDIQTHFLLGSGEWEAVVTTFDGVEFPIACTNHEVQVNWKNVTRLLLHK